MRMSRNKRASTREGSRSKAGTARIGLLLITASLDSLTSSPPDDTTTATRDTLSAPHHPHHHPHHHSMYHRQSQRQSHQTHNPAPAYNQGYGGYGGQPPPQQQHGAGYQGGGGYQGHQGGGGYPGYAPPPPPQRGPPAGADPELWHWFSAVDTDRSGSITVTELQSALVNGTSSLPLSSFGAIPSLPRYRAREADSLFFLADLGNWTSEWRVSLSMR